MDRPASVVKELMENSLDSGASRIEVELGEGGTSRIVVRDNGSGMSPEDARLSILRHATSKVRQVEDIEAVMTLGFRGEALPSIASVSAFQLITSTGTGTGTKVVVEGGGPVQVSPAAHPKGTTVLVDRIFYNVPARRAFLKSVRAERAAVIEAVSHLAIAHPRVAFRLTEGGRDYLSLPAASDLLERLAQFFGAPKARALRPVEYEAGVFKITGYAALPSLTESSRTSQTLAVNGRWVRGDNLYRALDEAYRATVPAGRYPPAALHLEVDPHRVDVNVHPTKQVVRFSEERAVRAALTAAVRSAIEWRSPMAVSAPRPVEPAFSQERITEQAAWRAKQSVAEERSRYRPQAPDLREAQEKVSEASKVLTGVSGAAELPERGALPQLEHLRVIGQLAAGYILVEEPESLWIVDQHVAHERTILDRLTSGHDPVTIQDLLIPEIVELTPGEAELAAGYIEELSLYGFEAEPFGSRAFRITGAASILVNRDAGGAFKEALSAVAGTEPGKRREERILATIACHSAVKLGDRLSHPEMEALIQDWLHSRLPATCPHGRSICYRIGVSEVARKLDRH